MTYFQHCHVFSAHLSCRQCPGDVPPQEGGLGRWQIHDTGSKGEGRGAREREGGVSLNSVGHITPLNTTSLFDLVKFGGTWFTIYKCTFPVCPESCGSYSAAWSRAQHRDPLFFTTTTLLPSGTSHLLMPIFNLAPPFSRTWLEQFPVHSVLPGDETSGMSSTLPHFWALLCFIFLLVLIIVDHVTYFRCGSWWLYTLVTEYRHHGRDLCLFCPTLYL